MYPDIGRLIEGLLWIAYISVPLAIWKFIEIIIWVFSHLEVSIK